MQVILIAGYMQNGKTSIGDALQEYFEFKSDIPCNVLRLCLATPVKRIATDSFGWDGVKDEKGRKLLQVIGSDAGRAYDEDIWVRILHNKTLGHSVDYVIVDDWRFLNEATYLIHKGISIFKIRVERFVEDELMIANTEHDSENSLSLDKGFYDVVLKNATTLQDIRKLAMEVAKQIEESN